MKYSVTVRRTASYLLAFEVEAANEEEAQEKALEIAGDHNFSDGKESGVEYEVDSVNI